MQTGHLRRLALSLYPGSLCGLTLGLQASHLGNMAFGLDPGGLFLLRKSSQTPLFGLGRSTLLLQSGGELRIVQPALQFLLHNPVQVVLHGDLDTPGRGEQRLQHIFIRFSAP